MVSGEALNAIECLPVLEELNCEPLDLKEALGSLAPGKAPSQNIIPSEILKCYKGDAFTELYSPLSFCKDFWGGYWGRAIKLLVNLFALSQKSLNLFSYCRPVLEEFYIKNYSLVLISLLMM